MADETQMCRFCGGTILPHAASGAERGSCHCPRGPGRVHATLLYGTATEPARRVYAVEWEGRVVPVTPPTLPRAVQVLRELRQQWAAQQAPPGTPHPGAPDWCVCGKFLVGTIHTHGGDNA